MYGGTRFKVDQLHVVLEGAHTPLLPIVVQHHQVAGQEETEDSLRGQEDHHPKEDINSVQDQTLMKEEGEDRDLHQGGENL